MPIIAQSDYKPPQWLKGSHLQTCWPTFFRRVDHPESHELRIDTPDGDFLDLYLTRSRPGNGKAAIICHGLEGNGRRKYILGMSRAFMDAGWDSISWNCRSCGKEDNRLPRLYHSGDTADLMTIISHAAALGYTDLVLVGFSMGGNQVLKLLGEIGSSGLPEVKAGMGVSVPCNLADSCQALGQGVNKLYTMNFLTTLKAKIRAKHKLWPEVFDISGLGAIRSFKEFDDRYTAPLHGFASAEDYWEKSSCARFLPAIRRPALIINAQNDPFLQKRCYPVAEAEQSGHLYLEIPQEGGHVGFASAGRHYWSELRVLKFIREFV